MIFFFAMLLWTAYHRVSRCPVKTRQEEEEGREGKVRVSQQQVCDETARPSDSRMMVKDDQVRSKTYARVSTRH